MNVKSIILVGLICCVFFGCLSQDNVQNDDEQTEDEQNIKNNYTNTSLVINMTEIEISIDMSTFKCSEVLYNDEYSLQRIYEWIDENNDTQKSLAEAELYIKYRMMINVEITSNVDCLSVIEAIVESYSFIDGDWVASNKSFDKKTVLLETGTKNYSIVFEKTLPKSEIFIDKKKEYTLRATPFLEVIGTPIEETFEMTDIY